MSETMASEATETTKDVKTEITKVITEKSQNIQYFVEVKTVGSARRQPKTMQNAFVSLKTIKLNPHWIKEEVVLEKEWSESSDKLLFVLDSFDGKVFDYLLSKQLRIISPLTVLYCYSKECLKPYQSIPQKTYPVFSQCMRKLFVSISGFDGQKKQEMITKITRMSGNFCKDFTKNVTHLVTDSVRTKKYKVAKERGVTVVSPLWIDECWNDCQHNLLSADSKEIVDKHRLKIFNKLLISVSRIEIEERKRVEKLVLENGGQYSPSLKLNEPNSVLLLRTPEGDKFKYAHIRGVPCLDVQWLYASVEKGYALPEDDYLIRPLSQSSQQMYQNSQELTENGIKPSNDKQMTTNRLTTNSSPMESSGSALKTEENLCHEKIEKLAKDNKSNESFLEGCDIFIFGFEGHVFETIKSALLKSGSMVYNEFKNLVTHVIVGPKCDDTEVQRFFDSKSCKIVSIDWVLECFKLSECCDTSPFEIKNPKYSRNNGSNSSLKRKRNSDDMFGGPLTVVLPKRAHKALEKWREDSRIDTKLNHKSLNKQNDNNLVQWGDDDNQEENPSQKSYRDNNDDNNAEEDNFFA